MTCYMVDMIVSIRHRGLRRFFERGDRSRIGADRVARIADILGRLDTAARAADLDLPGYRLHRLRGARRGYWSVSVSANWRIIFRFEDSGAHDVDLVDYH